MDDIKSIIEKVSASGLSSEAVEITNYIYELETLNSSSKSTISSLEEKIRELQDSNHKLYLNIVSSNSSEPEVEKEKSIEDLIYEIATKEVK